MNTRLFTSILTLVLLSAFAFAGNDVKEAKFKASGNCGMCQKRVEKSLRIKEVSSAAWNKKTKTVAVKYDASAISLDSLQKRVASVGHDTEKFKASDALYENLPGCCLYRETGHEH